VEEDDGDRRPAMLKPPEVARVARLSVALSDDLSAAQSWRGRFRLPDQPDQEQQGVLIFSPKALP